MSSKERISKTLTLLIPAGVIGISSALASVQAHAEPINADLTAGATPVAQRLSEIRNAVSTMNKSVINDASGARLVLADWLNFGLGWPNGGWRNWGNGWHNGGWHNWGNGWHNGWGNGGWHNWHNFWHNW